MGRAVLQAGRSADIHEFCFQDSKRADMVSGEMKGIYLLISRMAFLVSKFKIIAVSSCKRFELLMLKNSSLWVRNVEICTVLSSNEVDLLMLRKRVFRQRNVQKCAVQS